MADRASGGPGDGRAKSEVRRRTVLVAVRLLPEERDILESAAEERGMSLSGFLRSSAIDGAARPAQVSN